MTDWEAVHQSRHWGTYPEIYMVRQVKAFMVGKEGLVYALDIGCGAGAHTWMMDEEGLMVTAIDVSATAVRHLDKLMKRDNRIDVTAMIGDVNSVEFPPESFDFILDNLSLTHVENPPLDRILSWLRPGGRLISASFLVPPPGAPASWPVNFGNPIEVHARTIGDHAHVIGLNCYDKAL